jgi:ribonuclease E
MEEKRNNRSVERRLKDALRHDRARIQVGRISHFGLLEMSRQRLRAGVLEGSTSQCPHCQGTGIIRSIESVALAVLRGLEDHLLKQPTSVLALTTAEVALYILNHKRAFITEMERRYGVTIRVEASDRMQGANFTVERVAAPVPAAAAAPRAAVSMEWGFDREEGAAEEAEELAAEPARDERRFAEDDRSARTEGGSEEERRGRRRRRRRGRRDREGEPREPQRELHEGAAAPDLADEMAEAPMPSPAALVSEEAYEAPEEAESYGGGEPAEAMEAPGERSEGEGGERRRGRRRGRRGGRARRREGSEGLPAAQGGQVADDADRHEWGIAEVARPGAEQPSAYPTAPWRERTMGLVGSVEAPPRDNLHDAPARPSIVEQAGESTGRRPRETSPFAACAAEAIRLAVALAGGGGRASVRPLRPLEAPAEAAPVATPPTDLAPASRGAGPTDGDLGASGASKPVRTAELAPVGESAVESAAAPSIGESNVSSLADRQRVEAEPEPQPVGAGATETSSELRPARRGWWQRRFGGTE